MTPTSKRFKLKPDIFAQEDDCAFWREWGFGNVKQRPVVKQFCKWNLPAPTWVKLNFDGLNNFEAGARYVTRNEIGQPIAAGLRIFLFLMTLLDYPKKLTLIHYYCICKH